MTISKVVFIKTADQLTDKPVYTPVDWNYWDEEKQHLRDFASRKIGHFRKGNGCYQSYYWVVKGENGCHYPLDFVLLKRPGEGRDRFLKAKIQLLKELMG